MTELTWKPHQIETKFGKDICSACGRDRYLHTSQCPGVPVLYGKWANIWPDGAMTRKQLIENDYIVPEDMPYPSHLIAWDKGRDGFLWLYNPADFQKKKIFTATSPCPLCRTELSSDSNCRVSDNGLCDRCNAMIWSQEYINRDDVIILDSETTGLFSDSEIIELSMIDTTGKEIFNRRIRPSDPNKVHRMFKGKCAYDIHGISAKSLTTEHDFPSLYDDIISAVSGKIVLVYNAPYDLARLEYMCTSNNLPLIPYSSGHCVMRQYALFAGEWNEKHGKYKFQKLPEGDHSALGDCYATLDILRRMCEG